MKDVNNDTFVSLFKEAYQKCFGTSLTGPLSETESKHFSNRVFEETGLVIGAKSVKNYSSYICNRLESKQENPSIATLDTLARYVLNAPYIDEVQRKDKESHYPYWFQYKSTAFLPGKKETPKVFPKKVLIIAAFAVFVTGLFILIRLLTTGIPEHFTDDFHTIREDSLKNKGWIVKDKDSLWWERRGEQTSHLSLFTLRGDNWPDSANAPVIKNMLLRKITADCFAVEIHLEEFMPRQNWQQAGLLLLEDTAFTDKSVRLSIAYNDFFGGYNKPGEIILQAITSGGKNFTQPEEIAHIPLFTIGQGQEILVSNNLKRSALRIEKTGNHFRFLYATGPVENFAFKEAFSRNLLLKPRYIGLFALQGFVKDTNYIPARFSFFSLNNIVCEK